MSKGSRPRPFSVSNEEYANRWDAIFGKDLEKQDELRRHRDEGSAMGRGKGNSTPQAQAIKTQEELNELLDAIRSGDRAAMADAYGDILVTLVMGCACADLDLVTCFEGAYQEIKDRKGYLTPEGIFVKEV